MKADCTEEAKKHLPEGEHCEPLASMIYFTELFFNNKDYVYTDK